MSLPDTWIPHRRADGEPAGGVGVHEQDCGDVGPAVASFRLPFPVDDRVVPLAEAPDANRGTCS